jgi:hypothetical protein
MPATHQELQIDPQDLKRFRSFIVNILKPGVRVELARIVVKAELKFDYRSAMLLVDNLLEGLEDFTKKKMTDDQFVSYLVMHSPELSILTNYVRNHTKVPGKPTIILVQNLPMDDLLIALVDVFHSEISAEAGMLIEHTYEPVWNRDALVPPDTHIGQPPSIGEQPLTRSDGSPITGPPPFEPSWPPDEGPAGY